MSTNLVPGYLFECLTCDLKREVETKQEAQDLCRKHSAETTITAGHATSYKAVYLKPGQVFSVFAKPQASQPAPSGLSFGQTVEMSVEEAIRRYPESEAKIRRVASAGEPAAQSETAGPAELWLADLSLRCPKCASPALTSNNKGEHRCLHCLEKCTDETALPSVRSLIDKAVAAALAAPPATERGVREAALAEAADLAHRWSDGWRQRIADGMYQGEMLRAADIRRDEGRDIERGIRALAAAAQPGGK